MARFGIMVSTALLAFPSLLCIWRITALSTYYQQAAAWVYSETGSLVRYCYAEIAKAFSGKYQVRR